MILIVEQQPSRYKLRSNTLTFKSEQSVRG